MDNLNDLDDPFSPNEFDETEEDSNTGRVAELNASVPRNSYNVGFNAESSNKQTGDPEDKLTFRESASTSSDQDASSISEPEAEQRFKTPLFCNQPNSAVAVGTGETSSVRKRASIFQSARDFVASLSPETAAESLDFLIDGPKLPKRRRRVSISDQLGNDFGISCNSSDFNFEKTPLPHCFLPRPIASGDQDRDCSDRGGGLQRLSCMKERIFSEPEMASPAELQSGFFDDGATFTDALKEKVHHHVSNVLVPLIVSNWKDIEILSTNFKAAADSLPILVEHLEAALQKRQQIPSCRNARGKPRTGAALLESRIRILFNKIKSLKLLLLQRQMELFALILTATSIISFGTGPFGEFIFANDDDAADAIGEYPDPTPGILPLFCISFVTSALCTDTPIAFQGNKANGTSQADEAVEASVKFYTQGSAETRASDPAERIKKQNSEPSEPHNGGLSVTLLHGRDYQGILSAMTEDLYYLAPRDRFRFLFLRYAQFRKIFAFQRWAEWAQRASAIVSERYPLLQNVFPDDRKSPLFGGIYKNIRPSLKYKETRAATMRVMLSKTNSKGPSDSFTVPYHLDFGWWHENIRSGEYVSSDDLDAENVLFATALQHFSRGRIDECMAYLENAGEPWLSSVLTSALEFSGDIGSFSPCMVYDATLNNLPGHMLDFLGIAFDTEKAHYLTAEDNMNSPFAKALFTITGTVLRSHPEKPLGEEFDEGNKTRSLVCKVAAANFAAHHAVQSTQERRLYEVLRADVSSGITLWPCFGQRIWALATAALEDAIRPLIDVPDVEPEIALRSCLTPDGLCNVTSWQSVAKLVNDMTRTFRQLGNNIQKLLNAVLSDSKSEDRQIATTTAEHISASIFRSTVSLALGSRLDEKFTACCKYLTLDTINAVFDDDAFPSEDSSFLEQNVFLDCAKALLLNRHGSIDNEHVQERIFAFD